MKLPPFRLEEFWKKYEFTTPYILCSSDAEGWTRKELLALADRDERERWDHLSLNYTEIPGLTPLREEISKLYTDIQPEEIFTFAGAEEGIYCLMQVLVQPNDHVIVVEPAYQSLKELPLLLGADVTSVALQAKNKWQLSLEQMEKAFRKDTKLVVLNYPHNPTGALLSEEVLDGIVRLANKCGAYIFSDEVYRLLEIDPAQRVPAIADVYEKGISLNVMSKAFGLAGLRVGWLASKDKKLIRQTGCYKVYTSICNSAPSEVLSLIALRAKEKVIARNRKIVLDNLSLLDAFIERNKERVSWVRPQSGTMALLELLLPVSVEDFTKELAQQAGVLVMPASCWNLPGNYFRIGFGKKNMPEILVRFENFLHTYTK
ncbi:MAG: aminotransferase class I/II-fold pyridoxal phosphate-dependent enzyme [Bacteroidota bacterium]